MSNNNKIKLYVHIFPSTEFDWDCIKVSSDNKVLYVKHSYNYKNSLNTPQLPKFWCFNPNCIFLNCCQSEIYNTIMDETLQNVYQGIDTTVMSYGQNVSGKTFTMSGLDNQFELRGIIPRFINNLFIQVTADDYTSEIWMSVVDIYGNSIYDLLKNPKRLCKVKEVSRIKVNSERHCLEILFKAETRRMVIAQKTYRAHTATNIVTFVVKITSLSSQEYCDKISQVHFVDLAGVETVQRNPLTSFKDKNNQGAANVAKTLLEVFALRSQKPTRLKPDNVLINQKVHVITQYLGKSFSPSSRIKLICHIRPTHKDLMITLSLLKFGMTFQGIPMFKPEPHLESNIDRTMKDLRELVKSLEDEFLIRYFSVESRPMQISQDRIDFVKRAVQSFLKGDLSESELLSIVDDCSLILTLLREVDRDKQITARESVGLQAVEEVIPVLADDRVENLSAQMSPKLSKDTTPRRVSFKKPKTSIKTDKEEKSKNKQEKSKGEEKPEVKSEEVQVNLLEPFSTLPKIDTRESLWAQFVISRPDVQAKIDKFNLEVREKNKHMNTKTLQYDTIGKSLNRTEHTLAQFERARQFGEAIYDKEGRLVTSEGESNLVSELRIFQKEREVCRQQLTDAQTNWLDSLKNLDREKQLVEEDFKQFCFTNNMVTINKEDSLDDDESHKSVLSEVQHSVDLQEIYNKLQYKYLHKFFN